MIQTYQLIDLNNILKNHGLVVRGCLYPYSDDLYYRILTTETNDKVMTFETDFLNVKPYISLLESVMPIQISCFKDKTKFDIKMDYDI